MRDRHEHLPKALERGALEGKGRVPVSTRRAIADGRPPADLEAYVAKVRERPWTVTDEDVEALRRAGRSEDEIFEITVAAAVGAALERVDAGMAALRGEDRKCA